MAEKSIPIGGIRSFQLHRVRTLTGLGMSLQFGRYHFVLVGMDGTPERTLDDLGYRLVLEAIFKPAPKAEKQIGNVVEGTDSEPPLV